MVKLDSGSLPVPRLWKGPLRLKLIGRRQRARPRRIHRQSRPQHAALDGRAAGEGLLEQALRVSARTSPPELEPQAASHRGGHHDAEDQSLPQPRLSGRVPGVHATSSSVVARALGANVASARCAGASSSCSWCCSSPPPRPPRRCWSWATTDGPRAATTASSPGRRSPLPRHASPPRRSPPPEHAAPQSQAQAQEAPDHVPFRTRPAAADRSAEPCFLRRRRQRLQPRPGHGEEAARDSRRLPRRRARATHRRPSGKRQAQAASPSRRRSRSSQSSPACSGPTR